MFGGDLSAGQTNVIVSAACQWEVRGAYYSCSWDATLFYRREGVPRRYVWEDQGISQRTHQKPILQKWPKGVLIYLSRRGFFSSSEKIW